MPQLSNEVLSAVRDHLLERWDQDAIIQRFANVPTRHDGPLSVRAFIADMVAMPALARGEPQLAGTERLLGRRPFCQLDTSRFGELLAAELIVSALPVSIESLAFRHLFLPSLQTVITHDICSYPAYGDAQRAHLDLVETCGLPAMEFFKWIAEQKQVRALAECLWPEIRAHYADHTLLSFFTNARVEGWYCHLNPFSEMMAGDHPTRTQVVDTGLGRVTLQVQRTHTEPPSAVFVHEWRATLHDVEGKRLAVAAGTAYIPARKRCSAYEWLATADESSDVDIMQVRALIDQFPDEFGEGLGSGIAFLTMWERHAHAAKGAGREVLSTGLRALKQLLRRVKALAIDLRPSQFRDWDLPNDPPEIVSAKQDARERIASLIDSIKAEAAFGEDAARYLMLQRHEETDAQHALRLLGESEIARTLGVRPNEV